MYRFPFGYLGGGGSTLRASLSVTNQAPHAAACRETDSLQHGAADVIWDWKRPRGWEERTSVSAGKRSIERLYKETTEADGVQGQSTQKRQQYKTMQ